MAGTSSQRLLCPADSRCCRLAGSLSQAASAAGGRAAGMAPGYTKPTHASMLKSWPLSGLEMEAALQELDRSAVKVAHLPSALRTGLLYSLLPYDEAESVPLPQSSSASGCPQILPCSHYWSAQQMLGCSAVWSAPLLPLCRYQNVRCAAREQDMQAAQEALAHELTRTRSQAAIRTRSLRDENERLKMDLAAQSERTVRHRRHQLCFAHASSCMRSWPLLHDIGCRAGIWLPRQMQQDGCAAVGASHT